MTFYLNLVSRMVDIFILMFSFFIVVIIVFSRWTFCLCSAEQFHKKNKLWDTSNIILFHDNSGCKLFVCSSLYFSPASFSSSNSLFARNLHFFLRVADWPILIRCSCSCTLSLQLQLLPINEPRSFFHYIW